MADTLAHFQSRLLQALWEEEDAEAVRRVLLADDSLAEFHAYVEGMETRMIEVACELVRKWGHAA